MKEQILWETIDEVISKEVFEKEKKNIEDIILLLLIQRKKGKNTHDQLENSKDDLSGLIELVDQIIDKNEKQFKKILQVIEEK